MFQKSEAGTASLLPTHLPFTLWSDPYTSYWCIHLQGAYPLAEDTYLSMVAGDESCLKSALSNLLHQPLPENCSRSDLLYRLWRVHPTQFLVCLPDPALLESLATNPDKPSNFTAAESLKEISSPVLPSPTQCWTLTRWPKFLINSDTTMNAKNAGNIQGKHAFWERAGAWSTNQAADLSGFT